MATKRNCRAQTILPAVFSTINAICGSDSSFKYFQIGDKISPATVPLHRYAKEKTTYFSRNER
jgi:hypothetical protein